VCDNTLARGDRHGPRPRRSPAATSGTSSAICTSSC